MQITLKIEVQDTLIETLNFLASALAASKGMEKTVAALEEIKPVKVEEAPKENWVEKAEEEDIAAGRAIEEPVIPVVPTMTKEYTLDELAKASIGLMDKGLQAQLKGLLAEFNVAALPALDKTQYSAFALKLRELGADI